MSAAEAAHEPVGGLLVLGLGNVLCGDDGLGVVALDLFRRRYEVGEGVALLDGGTLGLSLLPYLAGKTAVILLDAIRADAPAGTYVRLDGEQVAPAVRERLSVHQIGVSDLLDGARLLGRYPPTLVLLGLVPASLELGLGLSERVAVGVDQVVEACAREVAARGYPVEQRASHVSAMDETRSLSVSHALGL